MGRPERFDAEGFGTWLDRERAFTFRFEGRRYAAFEGDTIASALAASGLRVLSRSFKYRRPRGSMTLSGHDANALVQCPGAPNTPADRTPVSDGLVVQGQNYQGSLKRDRGAWAGLAARFLPVGFYYRAFYRPRGAWNVWQRLFRRRAGLGVIDTTVGAEGFDKRYLFCDVLVVGGGAAGLCAALAAARAGEQVLLVDEQPHLGGALNYQRLGTDGGAAAALRADLVSQIEAEPNVRVMTGTTATGCFADNWVSLVRGRWLYKLRAQRIVLCTGVDEQHAVFHDNDLPGILTGSAAQRLMRQYGVRPGRRAVVLTGNDDGYAVALDLLDAGVEVAALVDLRPAPAPGSLAQAVRERGVAIRHGQTVYAAAGRGRPRRLARVELREVVGEGVCADEGEWLDCDTLCLSVGFMPAHQLACQAGATLRYDEAQARFGLVGLPGTVCAAGAANGVWGVASACADGAHAAGAAQDAFVPPVPRDEAAAPPNAAWPIFAHPDGKEFVDLDEDLTVADLIHAVRDGYDDVELLKRFSTCGMGLSQGRHSALPMARIVARETGRSVAQTGVTTARPPASPELIGHCAGRRFFPARRSAMHHRHAALGAQWLHAGDWYRPAFYASPSERERAIREEALRVRTGVGMIDVSTLGGIDVRGSDAGEFLDRVYTMSLAKLAVGRSRYALMVDEAGVVIDDGVACRFAEDHFYVTTTTGAAERVFRTLLRWQAQWRLDVALANVTSAWCGVNLAGPYSRKVLENAGVDVDVSAAGFDYLGVREGAVAGIPARLLRVGFVGELGYEIHVPQHWGEALWDALMAAGDDLALRPFGVEAQRALRLEKGHILVGQDTDATSNPLELDMAWALGRDKPFFVGGRALEALADKPLSRRLVGFVVHNETAPVPRENHLVVAGDAMIGRVTSALRSPTLGHTIGLAYVPPACAEPGTAIRIRADAGESVDAQVVPLPFFDPKNARQTL